MSRILIYVQIICQIILISGAGSLASIRPVVRTAAFGVSLLFLWLVPAREESPVHPARVLALAVLVIITFGFFNPDTDSVLAGVAHAAMYLAILSPIFWVSRLRFEVKDLRKLFFVIWLFYSLSSAVGILQFVYPGWFQPSLSSSIESQGEGYVASLMIETAEGELTFRPMGLTDGPGGAALGGFYAVLIGLGLFLTSNSLVIRVLTTLSMGLGMTCLYICQIRSLLIESVVCLVIFVGFLIFRARLIQVAWLSLVALFVLGGGFLFAYQLGGQTVTDRLATLIEDRPGEVYYRNRGIFLQYTIEELLPSIPLGAGLGRWGVMNAYFGDPAASIYAEIQWTGWLIDGGVPLILAYSLALLAAVHFALKAAFCSDNRLWVWGTVLLVYDLLACASTFNYPFFMSQNGLELWLLNAALFAAIHHHSSADPSLEFRPDHISAS